MNLENFIARRLIAHKGNKSTISSPIIKIAIIAVAISIFMMLLSVATGVGLQKKIQQKIAMFNGHITISNFDDNQSQIYAVPIISDPALLKTLKSIEGVTSVQQVATKSALIRTEETVEGIIFKGVDEKYNWDSFDEILVQGRLPKITDKQTDEILVSEVIAKKLGLKLNSICRTYFIKNTEKGYNLRSFIVVGIFNSGFTEFDSNFVIGDIKHVQRINKWKPNQVGALEVFIDDFSDIETINTAIYKNIPATLNTEPITQKYYSIFEWLKLFDFNIIVILIVMIVVSVINMAVALLVLILERTQMIGILKALGATNWTIRKIFLHNAFYIIIRGLLYGNIAALTLLLIQKYFGVIQLDPSSYYVRVAPVEINIVHFIVINISSILFCVLIMYIPSHIITKISPVKAIRFS